MSLSLYDLLSYGRHWKLATSIRSQQNGARHTNHTLRLWRLSLLRFVFQMFVKTGATVTF